MDPENLMQFPANDIPNQSASPVEVTAQLTAKRSNKGERFLRGTREMGSIGSSDTYASCNTQPFNSQTDLTAEDNVFDTNASISAPAHDNAVKKNTLLPNSEITLRDSCSGVVNMSNLSDTTLLKNWKTHFEEVSMETDFAGCILLPNTQI